MNADLKPIDNETARAPTRRGAAILPFDAAGGRRLRRSLEPTDTVGQILLFTGVRYERLYVEDTGSEGCALAASARTS